MRQMLDAIIVGQGLAGTTLAWSLREAGWDVLVLERGDVSTASQISAGLITPITGMRFGLSYVAAELEACRVFYRRIEAATQRQFFFDRTALRVFADGAEEKLWARRKVEPAVAGHLVPIPSASQTSHLKGSSEAGFAMRAAQLDVQRYLAASRAVLRVEQFGVDWVGGVAQAADHVDVGPYRARYIVACEGVAGATNPYFTRVPFKPAKGEILTVRFSEALPPISLHKGIWVAPTDDVRVFKVGTTFDWLRLDTEPSPEAREYLETKLADLVAPPFEVIEHRAAVRPIISSSRSRIGVHPQWPRIGYFNGLGTKGVLRAPQFAQQLRAHLVHGAPIAQDIDVRMLFEPAARDRIAVESGDGR